MLTVEHEFGFLIIGGSPLIGHLMISLNLEVRWYWR
jgi:hypothetical protein